MNHPHKSQAAAMDRAGELPDGEQLRSGNRCGTCKCADWCGAYGCWTLRECVNSGQVSAAQVVAHAEAGELQPEAIGKIFCYDPITKKPKIEWFRRPGDVGTKLFTEEQINAALAAERAEVARLRAEIEAIREDVSEWSRYIIEDNAPLSLENYIEREMDRRAALTAPGEKHE